MRKDENGNLCVEDLVKLAEDEFWMGINDRRNDKYAVTRQFASRIQYLVDDVATTCDTDDPYPTELQEMANDLFSLAEALHENPDYGGLKWKYTTRN